MRYIRGFTAVLFFILLFEEKESKSWRDYNLTVGPLKSESGRYMYEDSVGRKLHCQYCEIKALKDSTYDFLQQSLCIKHYDGKKIEEVVLPEERRLLKYPLCVKGEVPGCGAPPDVNKTKNHVWQCDPGYSLTKFSVYFTCALVCNITNKVDWHYYCNETLQWHAERSVPWQACEVPIIKEPEALKLAYIVPVAIGVLLIIAIIIIVCCIYWRKKKARSNENKGGKERNVNKQNNNLPATIERGPLQAEIDILDEGDPTVGNPSSGSSDSSVATSVSTDGESRPLLPSSEAASRTRDMACSTDIGTQHEETDTLLPSHEDINTGPSYADDTDELDQLGATGGHLPKSVPKHSTSHSSDASIKPKEQPAPSISMMLIEGCEKKQSIPLQGGHYSVMKGSDFAIIPSSTGGLTVIRFEIERKGDLGMQSMGKPFRGQRFYFWFVVCKAMEDDAGLFLWKMRLENNEEYSGSFEISIYTPGVREPPLGQEDDNRILSVRKATNRIPVQHQPSSTSHLKLDSMVSSPSQNNNNIVVNHCQHQQQQQCRAEVHLGTDPFNDAPRLSSDMLREARQRNLVDSGVQSDDRHNSDRAEPSASSRMRSEEPSASSRMRSEDNYGGEGVRSEEMRYSTSGYESQRSSEIARERFKAHFTSAPALNVNSFDSENRLRGSHSVLSDDILTENLLSRNTYEIIPDTSIHEDIEEGLRDDPAVLSGDPEDGSRPDPAGVASPGSYTEGHNSDDETLRKEYVDRETQQHSPGGNATDAGDIVYDRLDSVALHEDIRLDTNEVVIPRGEIQGGRNAPEIELENNISNSEEETSKREDETKL